MDDDREEEWRQRRWQIAGFRDADSLLEKEGNVSLEKVQSAFNQGYESGVQEAERVAIQQAELTIATLKGEASLEIWRSQMLKVETGASVAQRLSNKTLS